MGIYDREYYRSDGPSFLGSLADSGKICKWLVAVNVLVFILQILTRPGGGYGASSDPVSEWLRLDTNEIIYHGQVWRLITCAFLHADFWHIFFNMLFLWWFGHAVEDVYGTREFTAFYFAAALVSSGAYVAWQLVDGSRTPALGASGAVMAVTVLFAMHFPNYRIYIWFFPVSAWVFVLFEVGRDAYIFLGGETTMVAVTAHLGGAAFGFLYYKRQWRVMNWIPSFSTVRRQVRPGPRLRIYREEDEVNVEPVTASANPPAPNLDEQLEAQLDAVLAKVARSGKESLTDNERQVLLRASEIFKRRRS